MIDSLKETFKLGEKMEIKVMSDLEIEADREKYIASNKDPKTLLIWIIFLAIVLNLYPHCAV